MTVQDLIDQLLLVTGRNKELEILSPTCDECRISLISERNYDESIRGEEMETTVMIELSLADE